MKSTLILACVLGFSVGGAYASEQSNPASQEAVKMTQLLTIATCKGEGNLDEKAIVSSSTVYAALSPMESMGVTPDGVAKNRSLLTTMLAAVQCDSQGVLQTK